MNSDAIRALFATLVASPAVLPIPGLGQTRVRRTGFVTGAPERTLEDWIKSFREEMKDLGALGIKIPQVVLLRADRIIE